jgi:hypothetical protein
MMLVPVTNFKVGHLPCQCHTISFHGLAVARLAMGCADPVVDVIAGTWFPRTCSASIDCFMTGGTMNQYTGRKIDAGIDCPELRNLFSNVDTHMVTNDT